MDFGHLFQHVPVLIAALAVLFGPNIHITIFSIQFCNSTNSLNPISVISSLQSSCLLSSSTILLSDAMILPCTVVPLSCLPIYFHLHSIGPPPSTLRDFGSSSKGSQTYLQLRPPSLGSPSKTTAE